LFARQRERVDFWLDLLKPDEWELLQLIEALKKQRLFAKTVRDGIRLIYDLSQGKTDVLEELFPWVLDPVAEPRSSSDDNGRIFNELTEMRREFEEIKHLGGGHQVSPLSTEEAKPMLVSGNLKSLAGSSKPLPGPEDHDDLADMLEVKDAAPESGSIASQNFINSMLALQNVKSDKPSKPNKSVKRERRSLDDLLEIRTVGSA
jgi:hypothetical protein